MPPAVAPAFPSNDMPVGIDLTKEKLKFEFMDSCTKECPEIKHGATCSVQIKGLGKLEEKSDNRCLAFKSICETIKTKKLDPKKATEHTCSHP